MCQKGVLLIKRIESVQIQLSKMHKHQLLYADDTAGVTAEAIATALHLSRPNVSRDLNRLVTDGVAIKITSRPVRFLDRQLVEEQLQVILTETSFSSQDILRQQATAQKPQSATNFATLNGAEGSLLHPIKEAKAAILYPNHGLTTLITGESGVGKSLFAECMHRFAVDQGVIDTHAPFVVFNCADYADNQQLLLSHLFGFKRGSFTGAVRDEKGIVEIANNGILFLDEVHRLSHQGQEMLFYLMDKGIYKQLGETAQTHRVNLRIIMATTENPANVMLDTFLRRIPVRINLPALQQRPMAEKVRFVSHFFKTESQNMKQPIQVPKDIVSMLLNYHYAGNVGQLHSDIQCICAEAYIDYREHPTNGLVVTSAHLPAHLARDVKEQRALGFSIDLLPNTFAFSNQTAVTPYIDLIDDLNAYQKLCNQLLNTQQRKHVQESDRTYYDAAIKTYLEALMMRYVSPSQAQQLAKHRTLTQITQQILQTKLHHEHTLFMAKLLMTHLFTLQRADTTAPTMIARNDPQAGAEPTYTNAAIAILESVCAPLHCSMSHFDLSLLSDLIRILDTDYSQQATHIMLALSDDAVARALADAVNRTLGVSLVHRLAIANAQTVQAVINKLQSAIANHKLGSNLVIVSDLSGISEAMTDLEAKLPQHLGLMQRSDLPAVFHLTQAILSESFNFSEINDLIGAMTHQTLITPLRQNNTDN